MASGLAAEHLSVKGMPDILPVESGLWLHLEHHLLKLMYQYGYQQIRLPLLEKTALFKRAIGETTDVVEKEMFNFLDEKNRSLSLRPEGTAGCVRACIEHGLLRNLPQKLWYLGPMFRYEAPQKGRYRQFNQLGVECFGVATLDVELEQIVMFTRLWHQLNLEQVIQLQINNLGSSQVRNNYTQDLVAYFNKYYELLDTDSQKRLVSNPLRILDSKNPKIKEIIINAPKIYNYLDEASLTQYEAFKKQLTTLGIKFIENTNIVRGLDYYTGIVWEWTSNLLGAQSAVGGGGRYDNLVSQLGGGQVAAVGLALGIERIIILLQQQHEKFNNINLDGYLITVGEQAVVNKFIIAEQIRNAKPNISLTVDLLGGNFKNQFKRADKSGAKLAFIVGDDEMNQNSITVKYLREPTVQQHIVKLKDLENVIV